MSGSEKDNTMNTNLQAVRNADCNEKVAVDLIKTPETHGIELREEELEQVIAPFRIWLK